MRRLGLFIVAIALLGAASAAAHGKPSARLVIKAGSAGAVDGKVAGSFVVANQGDHASPSTNATVELAKQRIGTVHLTPLRASARRRVRFSATVPAGIAAEAWPVLACLERCRRIGTVTIAASGGAASTPVPATSPSQPAPASTLSIVPEEPLTYTPGTPFHHIVGSVEYWGFVPFSYDPDNQVPAPLLIWLHGCGGYSEGDIWVVDPGADPEEPQDWLTLALGGREGECWTPSVDEPKVMAALADFETHFNVDRRQVILGGYSSGGDLAYRTGFRNSSTFAGLLIENSAPFSETELSEAESLAAPTKFHVAHLAHTGDTTYPIETVRDQTNAMIAAGFPVELFERPGGHYDAHTDSDLREYLLPHIDDGWLAP